jgi:3-hydroxybutyryl-CoA dehydratase
VRDPVRAVLGTRPDPRTVGPVTQTDIVRFAGAGGDFNPLHHDPAFAATAGFDRPIAMGQFTAGLLAAWLTDWCGVEHLRAYTVRFLAPLLIGDTVVLSGEVVSLEQTTPGSALASLELSASREGTPVAAGTATVLVSGP